MWRVKPFNTKEALKLELLLFNSPIAITSNASTFSISHSLQSTKDILPIFSSFTFGQFFRRKLSQQLKFLQTIRILSRTLISTNQHFLIPWLLIP